MAQRKKTRVAMVTTWNCRCGIAEYVRYLKTAVEDALDIVIYASTDTEKIAAENGGTVRRCWRNHGELSTLCKLLSADDIDIIHFQFNFGLFKLPELASFIEAMAPQKKIMITFHATKCSAFSLGEIAGALNKVSAIIVHRAEDYDLLRECNVAADIIQLPHGIIELPPLEKQTARSNLRLTGEPVIATFGFLLPPKGVLEIIRAVGLLRGEYPSVQLIAACALYPLSVSAAYCRQCLQEIKSSGLEKHVRFITDFLAPPEVISLLSAADITVLAYQATNESSSAALRFCIAAQRPMVTTKLPIFAEAADCSYQIAQCHPLALAKAMDDLLKSPAQQALFGKVMAEKTKEAGWSKVGEKYVSLIENLLEG